MAIYKTTSSQVVIRKVMRDLAPQDSNWMQDAVEWIGEALEHIGASAQLVSKTCILSIEDHKCTLPADFYYLEQVALNQSSTAEALENDITKLTTDLKVMTEAYQSSRTFIADRIIQMENGTIVDFLSNNDLKVIDKINKASDSQFSRILAETQILVNRYSNFDSQSMQTMETCTNTFKPGDDCPDCNEFNSKSCYYIESDHIKTSFPKGKVCVAYKAFPTDHDCYPLVPDSISYKEAMFWYIFKKMLLRGFESPNGFNYMTAHQQWQYYCTQARNEAVFPDIPQMESYMNQWVRLIPNINRSETQFENLGTREDIYRGMYNTYGKH